MAQVIPISEDTDPQLLGLARSMATDMEAGRRPFKKSIVLDGGGFIVFQKIGDRVRALVGSGSVIVGYYVVGGDAANGRSAGIGSEALAWDSGGSMRKLPTLPGAIGQKATHVSRDGRTIVGTANMGTHNQAVMWQAGSVKAIDGLTTAVWVSNGGAIVVGYQGDAATPVKITSEGVEYLPVELTGSLVNLNNTVSDDGSTIVGYFGAGYPEVYRNGVLVNLPEPDPVGTHPAFAISPDGSVIVGESSKWVNGSYSLLEGTAYGASNMGATIAIRGGVTGALIENEKGRFPLDPLGAQIALPLAISASGKIVVGFFEKDVEGSTKEGAMMWVNSKPFDLSGEMGLSENGGFRAVSVSG